MNLSAFALLSFLVIGCVLFYLFSHFAPASDIISGVQYENAHDVSISKRLHSANPESTTDFSKYNEIEFLQSFEQRHPGRRKVYEGDPSWLSQIAQKEHVGTGFIMVWTFFAGVNPGQVRKELQRLQKAVGAIRREHPGANVTMIFSHKLKEDLEQEIKAIKVDVDYIGDGVYDDLYRATYRGKLLGWMRTPYLNTIYLDMDVFVCRSLYPSLNLLDRFDFMVTEEPTVHHDDGRRAWDDSPEPFYQYNTGLSFFRWNAVTVHAFSVLLDIIKDDTHDPTRKRMLDQRDFREMVWHAKPRVLSLPPTYSCRTIRVPDGMPTCKNTLSSNHWIEVKRKPVNVSLFPCYALHGNPAVYE